MSFFAALRKALLLSFSGGLSGDFREMPPEHHPVQTSVAQGQQRATASERRPFVAFLPSAGRLPDPLLDAVCNGA